MDSEQQEMCATASDNAIALEKSMATVDMVMRLSDRDADCIIDKCEQIIHCMRECFDSKGE